MYTLLIVSFLVLLGGALGHPLDKRDIGCSNVKPTVNLVCQSLWYLEGTIAHCPNGSACNQTALNGIKSAIQSDLCSCVSLLAKSCTAAKVMLDTCRSLFNVPY